MTAAASVLVCALDLLGRSASQLPPIVIVEAPPAVVSANAEAFVNRSEGAIYLIASAPSFRVALRAEQAPRTRGQCAERTALKMIASIIVHEEWHLKHGSDERGAYLAQLTELHRLGLGAGTWANHSVIKSMQAVLAAQAQRQPPGQLVAAVR